MIQYFTYRINKIAIYISIVTFSSGFLLFLLDLFIASENILSVEIIFVLIAMGVNSILVLVLLLNTIIHIRDLQQHMFTILIVLLNLPIATFLLTLIN
ncbi:MAG: hypothetical protein V3U92_02715 [Cellulophaga sp.]